MALFLQSNTFSANNIRGFGFGSVPNSHHGILVYLVSAPVMFTYVRADCPCFGVSWQVAGGNTASKPLSRILFHNTHHNRG